MRHFEEIGASDERVQAMLCRWAESKYRVTKVERVEFLFREGFGGGCETCGYGADEDSLTVRIQHQQGNAEHDVTYDTDLLNEILAFATGEKR